MTPHTIIEEPERVQRGEATAAVPRGQYTSASEIPQRTYVTGITVAIAGILAFFLALVSAYVVRKGSPGEDWQSLRIPHVLWLNTAIILLSSLSLERSRTRHRANDQDGFRHWWNVTAILGVLFLAGQLMAWRQLAGAGIYLSTNPSSSFFYLLTAAHGLHLFGGIAALLVVACRPSRWLARGTAIEVMSIYWHFITAIWICLFGLFLLGS